MHAIAHRQVAQMSRNFSLIKASHLRAVMDHSVSPERGESMAKNTRAAATRHRTLWVSDVHLGSPGSKAKKLVEFLKRNDCETLYLVGDIFDGWKMKSRFYW